ncbi:MAG: hypothetical protein LIO79_00805 [Rikenellaceae bacterium]|nr:hypothetical protein [Rikenellaceae bacterium]
MGFDITRQSLLKTILLFLFMYAIFGIREYVFSVPVLFDREDLSFLGELVYNFSLSFPFLNEILIFILLFVNAFYITSIATRNLILVERSYLPAIIYIVISAGYVLPPQNVIPLTASFFIIAAIDNIINSYKRLGSFSYFFNAGICMGTALLIYPQIIPYIVLLPFSLIYFIRTWRDWLLAAVGLGIPLFFISYICWGLGTDFKFVSDNLYEILADGAGEVFKSVSVTGYVLGGFYFILAMFGIIVFFTGRGRTKKRAVKLFVMFVWMLGFTGLVFALEENPLLAVPITAIPLSVVIPVFFNRKKGIIPNLLFAAIIIITIIYNFVPILGI